MMNREGQILLVVETTAAAATLQFLSAHGAASGTIEWRERRGMVLLEVLGPAAMSAGRAVEVGARLTELRTTRAVAVVALDRRERASAAGVMFERRELAGWSRPVAGTSTARLSLREAA